MKRDMDLIRDILTYIEENISINNPKNVVLPDYATEEIAYHLQLLDDADLVRLKDMSDSSGLDFWVYGLTWNGHEFLEAAKDETRWETAKRYLKEKVGSLPFSILQSVLLKMITGELKL